VAEARARFFLTYRLTCISPYSPERCRRRVSVSRGSRNRSRFRDRHLINQHLAA